LNLLLVGLSDFQIRDLNDEINKLMREKYRWEMQIKDLGGVDYRVWLYDNPSSLSLTLSLLEERLFFDTFFFFFRSLAQKLLIHKERKCLARVDTNTLVVQRICQVSRNFSNLNVRMT